MGNPMNGLPGVPSPYTPKNADAAIEHLERVLSLECVESYFGQSYWRARVSQLHDTAGLTHSQQLRVRRLLGFLACHSEAALPRGDASRAALAASMYA
jgi:hypothetical protein